MFKNVYSRPYTASSDFQVQSRLDSRLIMEGILMSKPLKPFKSIKSLLKIIVTNTNKESVPREKISGGRLSVFYTSAGGPRRTAPQESN